MIKRLIAVSLLLTLTACINPLAAVSNPINTTNLYQGELVFDASLKVFNKGKDLCARRVIAPVCRTYVIKGQKLIIQIASADQAAREFVDNNPTLDATNVVQAFTGLVSKFDATATSLSKL